jgi:hypothetical protein
MPSLRKLRPDGSDAQDVNEAMQTTSDQTSTARDEDKDANNTVQVGESDKSNEQKGPVELATSAAHDEDKDSGTIQEVGPALYSAVAPSAPNSYGI